MGSGDGPEREADPPLRPGGKGQRGQKRSGEAVPADLRERAVGTETQGAPESDDARTSTTVVIVTNLFLSVECGPGTAGGRFQSLSSHTCIGSRCIATAISQKGLRHELAQDQLAQGERWDLNPEPWQSGP